tara:strand:- start:1566 stop:1811 length:246 start_codon:yes stop_codon:yes gene_type:complete
MEFTFDFDQDLAKFSEEELAGLLRELQQQHMNGGVGVKDIEFKNYVEDLYVRKQLDIDVEVDDAYGGLNVEEILKKEVDKH